MKPVTFEFALSAVLSLAICLAASLCCQAQELVPPAASLIEVKHNVRGAPDHPYLREGDQLNLQVRAIGDIAVYVYVIYQDANDTSTLLFPSAADSNNLVTAGQFRTVPGRDSLLRFGVAKPFGDERLQVFASPEPLPQIEQQFHNGRAAEELDELLRWIALQRNVEVQVSEFETRSRRSDAAASGPSSCASAFFCRD